MKAETVMRIIGRVLKWLGILIAVVVVGTFGWLYLLPPELFRVGTAYAAKIVCSNVHLAGRDAAAVLADDVQAPGHPLLKYLSVQQPAPDTVSASLFGLFATGYAVYRPGLGCAVVADGDIEAARAVKLASPPAAVAASDFEWPTGDEVSLPANEAVKAVLSDDANVGPGFRAVVVIKDNRIVGERYGEGFGVETPLLGWSMTKTVTGALVAARVAEGKLSWTQDKLRPDWTDDRGRITIADLMAMRSGLDLEESYGDVNDVTRMLFLEPDQAAFVAAKSLEAAPGSTFEYTTGSTVLLTKVWMDTFADRQEALAYPQKALFGPIGMRSAVLETDEAGTFSGGSLMYATARDWARFGLLLLNGGDWNGVQVLSPDYAKMVSTPTALSGQHYTEGLAWKSDPGNSTSASAGLPADTYWALGHDGQSMAIIPSEGLVVVRLGLTPSSLAYEPENMVGKIVAAARIENAAQPEAVPSDAGVDAGEE
jgi:CubicO group peptidase (beta-lactamase class C family)